MRGYFSLLIVKIEKQCNGEPYRITLVKEGTSVVDKEAPSRICTTNSHGMEQACRCS